MDGTIRSDALFDAVANANLPAKFAPISASSSGANAVVAAVTGKKVRVLSYLLVAAGAVNLERGLGRARERSRQVTLATRWFPVGLGQGC